MRGSYLERRDVAGREFPVQNHDPDLRHTVRPFFSPAHLSLPAHAVADHLVHRGFGDAAADRQTLAMPDAVGDQRVRVVPPVPGDSVQVPLQQLNSYPSLVSSRPSSALIRSTSLLPLPCQTNHLARLISVSTAPPFQRGDHLAAEHGTLRRLELHLYVEPVEDPAASQLTALDGLLKFTSVVADHGHAFIARHTVSTEELIESRCSRGDFLVYTGIQLSGTVRERRSPGDDVHAPSASLASMINRMVCSHRCHTSQRTPHETRGAPGSSSRPP